MTSPMRPMLEHPAFNMIDKFFYLQLQFISKIGARIL